MPGPVGKPFDQRRDRRDVADAEAACRRARRSPDRSARADASRRRSPRRGSRRQAERGGEHRLARADPRPSGRTRPADRPRKTIAMLKIQPELGQLPVVGRGLGDADQLGHRQVEYAEGVGLADAQMHAKCGGRHQPAVEARARRPFAHGQGNLGHGVFSELCPVLVDLICGGPTRGPPVTHRRPIPNTFLPVVRPFFWRPLLARIIPDTGTCAQ